MAKDKQNTWFCLLLFICTCRYKECMHCIKCLIIYIFLLNFFIKNLYKSFLIMHLVTDLSTLPSSSGTNHPWCSVSVVPAVPGQHLVSDSAKEKCCGISVYFQCNLFYLHIDKRDNHQEQAIKTLF